MKKIHRSFWLCACLTVLTACKPEPAPQPQPLPEAAAPTTENPVDATAVVENTPSASAGVDSKALAGKYSDGESVLELHADGTYLQTLQAGGSTITADGSWSSAGDAALLLDPNSKSAADARFEVVSQDELRAEDGARTFRRVVGD